MKEGVPDAPLSSWSLRSTDSRRKDEWQNDTIVVHSGLLSMSGANEDEGADYLNGKAKGDTLREDQVSSPTMGRFTERTHANME